ncbi:alpha-1,3-glucosyltransferase [Trichonephila clavipes]|nr:alpha-1,3-glucosyltransferase [Trichonephila clavipes]
MKKQKSGSNKREPQLTLPGVNVSLAFFMFSFQVHEKTILFPALPVLLLLEDHPLACIWFGYISTFSLVPLLAKDGLMIPFMALSALFIIGAIRAYEDLILSFKNNAKFSSLAFGISILGSLILIIAMYKVKQPDRYPHLHILLNSVYCGIHFVGKNIAVIRSIQLTLSSTDHVRCVGERCTLNLSRAQTSSRRCGVVVRRGGCQLRYRPRHLTMVQNYEFRRHKSPRVAEQCDVNIHELLADVS